MAVAALRSGTRACQLAGGIATGRGVLAPCARHVPHAFLPISTRDRALPRPRPLPMHALARRAMNTTAAASQYKLIIYSKPGCHLCDGLKEKVEKLLERSEFLTSRLTGAQLEVRNILTNPAWEEAYGLVIPVLTIATLDGDRETKVPRPSPRASIERLGKHIEDCLADWGPPQHTA